MLTIVTSRTLNIATLSGEIRQFDDHDLVLRCVPSGDGRYRMRNNEIFFEELLYDSETGQMYWAEVNMVSEHSRIHSILLEAWWARLGPEQSS